MDSKIMNDLIKKVFDKGETKTNVDKSNITIKNLISTSAICVSESAELAKQIKKNPKLGMIIEAWSKCFDKKDNYVVSTLLFNAKRRVFRQESSYTKPFTNEIIEESLFIIENMKIGKKEYLDLIKKLQKEGYIKRTLLA